MVYAAHVLMVVQLASMAHIAHNVIACMHFVSILVSAVARTVSPVLQPIVLIAPMGISS